MELSKLPLSTGKHARRYATGDAGPGQGDVARALPIVLATEFLQLAAAAQGQRSLADRRITTAVTRYVYRGCI